jgi:hypothetical protein
MLMDIKKCFFAFFIMFVVSILPLTAEEDFTKRSINVYWTDTPPLINGKMDDTCWQQAEAQDNFRTFQKPSEAPTQQTEVRVSYNASHLYVFYKLYEKEMDKLMYGPPEDMRDMLNFSADLFEFFIDPGLTRDSYYHFCASPTAARYDASSKKGSPFNPDWQVVTGIEKNLWTAEIAIPFTELTHNMEFHGTPQTGEKWGIQFCRSQGRLKEWSQWVPTPRGFHEVKLFGTATFLGRKKGENPPAIVRTDKEPLGFGRGTLIFNTDSKVAVNYIIKNNGDTIKNESFTAEKQFQIPWHITTGGNWDVLIKATANNQTVYTGKTVSILPEVTELLENIQKQTASARKRLTNFKHPKSSEMRKNVDNLLKEALPSINKAEKASALSNEEWQELLSSSKSLTEKWKKIEFDIHLIQFYPKDDKIRSFTLGTAGPYEKIYPFTLYSGQVAKPVQLSAAGGEYESFQVVVIPFWKELKNINVELTNLKGNSGTIGSENLSWRIVDYVHLEGLDPDSNVEKIQPDILMPGKTFTVPSGQLRSIWIDVHCPLNTPAGEYKGEISLESEGEMVRIPLTLTSYGFNLPEKASLENNFWFDPGGWGWGRFYGLGVYGKIPYTTDIYRKQAEMISRYRITPFCDSALTMAPFLTIYHEGDGKFSFDFSKMEEFFRIGLEYGGNSFRASLSCNLGAMYLLRSSAPVIDKKTGEKTNLKRWLGPWEEKFKKGETYYDEHPVWPQYLTAWVDFLKKTGLLEISTFEIYDEPNSNPRWLDMIRHHKWLRKHVPALPLLNCGVEPLRKQAGKRAIGLHDVWAPFITGVTPEVLESMQERRIKYGEKYWYYTCGERRDVEGKFSPYIYYHRPYIGPRMHSWFAWDMQADGMLIFMLNGVPESNTKKEPAERWPVSVWMDGKSRGCGTLIYPGPNFEVIPGIRLVSARDGLEDYEYFKKLHDLSAYLNEEEHHNLIEQVNKELKIEHTIIKDYYNWTKDTKLLEAKRKRIAELIIKIEKLIDAL